MDLTTIVAIMAGCAVVSRNIVQWLKVKQWATNVYEVLFATWIVNFILVTGVSIGMYWFNGGLITGVVVKSVIAAVLSALYHDFNTNKPQVFIQQTMLPTPPPAQSEPLPVENSAPVDQP